MTDTTPSFDALSLSSEVRKAVDEMGFTTPTPVQLAAFEPAGSGADVVVQARTGTGKTAAFGLPLVDKRVRPEAGQQALILAPTRELALQSAREIARLGAHRGIRTAAVYGGAPMEKQVRELAEGAQIVSGTPGRVLDHLQRGTLRGEDLRILVLDEADEMLSMGFAKELNAIVELLPKTRQTMLFSATMDEAVQRLASRLLKDPVQIALSSDAVGALTIDHVVYMTSGVGKTRDLIRVLEAEDPESAIIFCNTKAVTEQVATELGRAGFQADWLNGDLPQGEREKVLGRTREGQLRYLVCTDVAARGIDISHLTHVVNFDFPEQIEAYVHRTGRTGRAGRTGTAISLITPQDLGALYYVRLSYKIFPVERSLPSVGEMQTRKELDRIELLREAFDHEPSEADRSVARRLLVHDDAEQIIGGLVAAFMGTRGPEPEVDEQAAAARRARVPRDARIARGEATPIASSTSGSAEAKPEKAVAETPAARSNSEERTRRRRRREPAAEASPPAEATETRQSDAPLEATADSSTQTDLVSPEAESDMATVFLNVGRRDGVRVTDVLRLFDTHVQLSKDQLGRIRIRDRHTFVGVPKEKASFAIESLTGVTSHEKSLIAELSRAEQKAEPATAEPSEAS